MKIVPLAEIASVTSGITKGRRTAGATKPVPYLAVSNVQAGHLRLDVVKEIEATSAEIERFALEDGDLVLTEGGDPDKLGRGTVWRRELPLCLHQNHIFRVRLTKGQVSPDYLARYMASSQARSYFRRSAKQTTGIASINMTQLKALPVGVPQLDEQRRISAILDHADAIRAKRRQILTYLDILNQSIFRDMFRDAPCERVAIGSFADVRTGSTPSRKDPENFGGSIPWVKTTEVQGGTITETSEYVTEEGIRRARLRVYPSGSVVVAMYGQGRTRGQSAILGMPATTNQACAVIMPNDTFEPAFLQAQLALSYDRLRGEAEGGNQPNLSIGRVAAFEVLLPPVDAQREFSATVGQIDAQRTVIKRAIAADDELFASLQSRAFRGEL